MDQDPLPTHDPAPDSMFQAYANVVKGGNRLLQITAHVVCRDANGQVKFEQDAVATIPIPAGEGVPIFRCEDVRSFVIPRPAGEG